MTLRIALYGVFFFTHARGHPRSQNSSCVNSDGHGAKKMRGYITAVHVPLIFSCFIVASQPRAHTSRIFSIYPSTPTPTDCSGRPELSPPYRRAGVLHIVLSLFTGL